MKRFFFIANLCFYSLFLMAAKNREPDSPKHDYKFSLKIIQDSVRAALLKADAHIEQLTQSDDIKPIAELYFKDYLSKISSYNVQEAQTVDLIESYKTDLVNSYVVKELKDRYPKYIYDGSKWMFNSVGGIYAHMLILYCSTKEYIVIWGNSLRAENKFSGYYPFMNEFDVMTRGEMQSNDLDAPGHAPVVYRPYIQDGIFSSTVDTSNLIPKNVRSYNLAPHSYMVSYAQGNMLKAFVPGTIMPGVFVNQDWAGMKAHIRESVHSYYVSKKKHKEKESDWQAKNNYRPIRIIGEFLAAKEQK